MPTNLTGETIAATYPQLLHINDGPAASEKTVYSGTGTPTAFRLGTASASVDNIRFNGNTISTTDDDGSLLLTPNGIGSVVISKVSILGGLVEGITDLAIADGGTGASDAPAARSNLGLGTLATQDSDDVDITGGSITGVTFTGSMSISSLTVTTFTGTTVNAGDLQIAGGVITNTVTNGSITLVANGTGLVQSSSPFKAATVQSVGALGYAAAAHDVVTQASSKTTGVTLDKVSGTITMNAASLADNTTVNFIVTDSLVAATDVPVACIASGGTLGAYRLLVSAVGAGSFTLALTNNSGGALAEAVVINFVIIKGAMT